MELAVSMDSNTKLDSHRLCNKDLERNETMNTTKYVYWQDEGMWLGYLEEYPDYGLKARREKNGRESQRYLCRPYQRKYPLCPRSRPTGSGMKRTDLIRELETLGCVLIRHGAKHDWYQNPNTKVSQPVPRHREINEHLARHIIRMLRAEP
jgi:predicted RNA binding protein YcfA (HicA-like mRNA interferase family)